MSRLLPGKDVPSDEVPGSGALTRANLKALTTARRRDHAHERGQKSPSSEIDWQDYRSERSWSTPREIPPEIIAADEAFNIDDELSKPTILRKLILEDSKLHPTKPAQDAAPQNVYYAGNGQEDVESATRDPQNTHVSRNVNGPQPEEPSVDHEADKKPGRPFLPPPDFDPDPAKRIFAPRDPKQMPAWNPFRPGPDAPTDLPSGLKSNPFSQRLPNKRPDIPRCQPSPQSKSRSKDWPGEHSTHPGFPPTFPAYHCTQNMNEIAAYLANASYVASLAGPPLADLKYGVIIVPASEESLLFGRSPDFVISKEFIDAVDDANRDYDRALRMHDADKDSAEFVRHRFDDDFPSVEVEAQRNVEVGFPERGGGEEETVEEGGGYVAGFGDPEGVAGEDGQGLGGEQVEGLRVEDAEAPDGEDAGEAGAKGLDAAEVGDADDPEERQSKRQRRCE